MNHGILKQIILDQHETIRNGMIVPREYTFQKDINYILVGLRRAGKSTLLYSLVQEYIANGIEWDQIIYINFEDERLIGFSSSDFNDILAVQAELSDKEGYFFLDEVQNIEGWEKFARRMADSKKHIYITGSNAKMLNGDIETTLGGRFLTKYIDPYDFKEFLRANSVDHGASSTISTQKKAKIARAFQEYFNYGGFPETLMYDNKREYISSIYQKILLGDIIVRNNVRNPRSMQLLIKKVAESTKDEISYSKLCNIMKNIGLDCSKSAIISYLGYAIDAYLIFEARNYVEKFSDKESAHKYYFSDNGILALFLDNKNGILLENLVALSIRRKYKDVYYIKSNTTGIDVDFYIPEEKTAIQVSYSIENTSSTREVDNLVRLSKKMNEVEKFIILTYEEEKTIDNDKIEIEAIPLWKWLLEH